jgi:hypothetical protein
MSSGRSRPKRRQAVRTALASLEDGELAAKAEGSTWPRRRRSSISVTHSGQGCTISTVAGAPPARVRPLLGSSVTRHWSLGGGREGGSCEEDRERSSSSERRKASFGSDRGGALWCESRWSAGAVARRRCIACSC